MISKRFGFFWQTNFSHCQNVPGGITTPEAL